MTLETGMSEQDIDARIMSVLSDEQGASDEASAPVEEAEAVEVEATETESEESPEVVAEESDVESEDQEPEEIAEPTEYTINELAEALDDPVDEFLQRLKVDAKIDGNVETLTLGELRSGYQRESDYTRKTQALAEQRKASEAELTQKAEIIQAQHAQLAGLIQAGEQQLGAEWNQAEMNQLREVDPAEYAARVTDFQRRAQYIEAMKQQGMQQWQSKQAELESEKTQLRAQRLQESAAKLSESIPGWADGNKRQAISGDVYRYATETLRADKELLELIDTDSSAFMMAYKSMMSDRGGDVAKKVQEKVKNLPKVLKPGNKKTRQDRQKAKLSDRLKRFKKTGSEADLDEFLLSRM